MPSSTFPAQLTRLYEVRQTIGSGKYLSVVHRTFHPSHFRTRFGNIQLGYTSFRRLTLASSDGLKAVKLSFLSEKNTSAVQVQSPAARKR